VRHGLLDWFNEQSQSFLINLANGMTLLMWADGALIADFFFANWTFLWRGTARAFLLLLASGLRLLCGQIRTALVKLDANIFTARVLVVVPLFDFGCFLLDDF